MRKLLFVLVFVLSASVAQAQEKPDWMMRAGYVSLAAVSMADIETTGRALELGLKEQNPIYKPFVSNPGMVGIVNGSITGAIGVAAHSLHKKGKKKEARIIVWSWTAVRAFVVFHNIREINKRR